MLKLLRRVSLVVMCACSLNGASAQDKKPDVIAPEARAVLDRVRAHYDTRRGFEVTVNSKVTMGQDADEEEPTHSQAFSVKAARPNRIAVRVETEGTLEHALISDGERLWIYYGGFMNKYEEQKAPESAAGLLEAAAFGTEPDASVFMQPHLVAIALLDGKVLADLLERSQAVTLVGREDVDGKPHDRIKVKMDRNAADLWFAAEGEPWLTRVVPDMSEILKELPEELQEEMRGRLPRMEFTLSDWKKVEAFPEGTFAFAPPAEAEKVDSLRDAMRAEAGALGEGEEHADLLGKTAPELELDLLGGGKMTLAEHRGKHVVMLDFWATWCPPCVKGLPIVAETAASMKDKGVVFYAVNQAEPVNTIQKFLEKRELKVMVALDPQGQAGQAFGVSGIPQTVLIGKDGTVQAVHVGFMPGMEQELKEQLEQLVEGKTLADPTAADGDGGRPAANPARVEGRMEYAEVWSQAGHWTTCAVDPATGEVYGLRSDGRLERLDPSGKIIESNRLGAGDVGTIRLARLGEKGLGVLTFRRWGDSVTASDGKGQELWDYALGHGVDDVWAADLDADGKDEIIVGYNGSTGLHALNADGTLRWKYTGIGNVWHVTAAPDLAGAMQVITTSAEGVVHVFSPEGKRIKNLRPAGYAGLVRVAQGGAGAEQVIITEIDVGAALSAMTREGKKLWRVEGSGRASDGVAAPGMPWIAIVGDQGVRVHDVNDGSVLLHIKAAHAAAWLAGEGDEGPLLVVASSSGLRAGTLKARAEPPRP